MILLSSGSKGTEIFWQTSAGAEDLALPLSSVPLLLHLGPLPGSPYPGPRAEVAVRCLGPSSAVLSPLGLRCPCSSTDVIQLASLCLELPCGGYKQPFDSVPAHSGREGAALLAGDGEWEVSPSAPPLSSPFLEQEGLASSTLPIPRKNWRREEEAEQHAGVFL